jgi:hypothetical protein
MRSVDDITLDQPELQAKLAERVGITAIESLEGFWCPRGYHVDNRKIDLAAAEEVEAPAQDRGEGEGERGDELGGGTPDVESIGTGAFNLATIVCLDAMLDALIAVPNWLSVDARRLAINPRVKLLLMQDPARADPLHPDNDSHPCLAILRYSVLISALAKLIAWRPNKDDLQLEDHDESPPSDQEHHADSAPTVRALQKQLTELRADASDAIGRHAAGLIERLAALSADERSQLHPYVIYRVIGALEAVDGQPTIANEIIEASGTERAALWQAHKPHLEELVAQHALNSLDAGAAIRMLFGAAIAARMSANEYVDALLGYAIHDPRVPTIWNQGRILAQDRKDLAVLELSFPALEAPRALAEIVLNSLDDTLTTPLLKNRTAATTLLINLLGNTQADHIRDIEGGVSGWAGDRIYGDHVIEAWPTASALGYGVAMAEIVDRVQRSRILNELHAIESWGKEWPAWLRWSEYLKNEPEQGAMILRFIDEKVVQPRKLLHSSAKTEAVVVLLFGPPGTTKTTIARSVANGLGWPIVMLSPGNFIEDGLERIEKRATWVFTRLQQLSRTVVILDECDELFRRRDPAQPNEAVRQVSAFMTASMLPKVQDLHDRSEIVVFICTNFLTSIDGAMRRPGRVDHLIAVSPPDAAQRERVIKNGLDIDPDVRATIASGVLEAAVEELADRTEGLIRGELVSAARQLGKLLAAAPTQTDKQARAAAKEIGKSATTKGRTAINPDDDQFKGFVADRQVISEPHRNVSR